METRPQGRKRSDAKIKLYFKKIDQIYLIHTNSPCARTDTSKVTQTASLIVECHTPKEKKKCSQETNVVTVIYTLPRHTYSLFHTEHPKVILPQETENYILNTFRFMLS